MEHKRKKVLLELMKISRDDENNEVFFDILGDNEEYYVPIIQSIIDVYGISAIEDYLPEYLLEYRGNKYFNWQKFFGVIPSYERKEELDLIMHYIGA